MAGYIRLVDLERAHEQARHRRHGVPGRLLGFLFIAAFLGCFWTAVALLAWALAS